MNSVIEYLGSLDESELQRLLKALSPEDQRAIVTTILQTPTIDPRAADVNRKRTRWNQATAIQVPPVEDPERRERLLSNAPEWLKFYLADRFTSPFSRNHLEMIRAIEERARYGGDQAIAAPRGEGKTEITTGMVLFAILKGLVRFPVIVAATGVHAYRIFVDLKRHLEANDRLLADFPEVCWPIRELDGAPQRAAKQHVNGVKTGIEWHAKHVVFPKVPGSRYSGVAITYAGLDQAIRGLKIGGKRPDFVLIDDPETRESAESDVQIESRETIIDRDLAGLVGPGRTLARVMLCTRQNRRCISYKYTDQTQKPSWHGKCYRFVERWPDAEDLWQEYIELRKADQRSGDEHGRRAVEFYLKRREEMDKGSRVSNPNRYDATPLADGTQVEYSAIQSAYNKISDTSYEAFLSEYQNDPTDLHENEAQQLTARTVQNRMNGLPRGEAHADTIVISAGLDLGKYSCHWVIIGWLEGAIGHVLDYGVLEVPGLTAQTTEEAAEMALYKALLSWRMETMDLEIRPDIVLIDTGTFTKTAYSFIRDVGGPPFYAAKGITPWRAGVHSRKRIVGDHFFATEQTSEQLWLYHLDTDYWKLFVHERFRTPTFDESHSFMFGTLSLFAADDDRTHLSYAHHICAEERHEEFKIGRGVKRFWKQVSRNNHWLDATYLACAGARMKGIDMPIGDQQSRRVKDRPRRETGRFTTPGGQPYLVTERT